jgi:hypothetical protein
MQERFIILWKEKDPYKHYYDNEISGVDTDYID